MSYEEAIKELETIINKLSNDSLPIEEAKKLFGKGSDLAKICHEHVKDVKGRIFELKEELGKFEEIEQEEF